MEFDVLLRGGRLLDGTGDPAFAADIAITGDRIVALGDLSAAAAATDVDITGRHVAPGFIDVHAHTDLAALLDEQHLDIKSAGIRQGVTTEVCGNCGASPFPLSEGVEDPFLGLYPKSAQRSFRSFAEYRGLLDDVPMVANLAPLLGHGALRAAVIGPDDRRPSSTEMDQMRQLVAQAMEEGAFGLSTGLIYAPGLFATTEELVELATIAGRFGRPYTTHMRDEADHVLTAIDEAIGIGRAAGTSVQISHHKVAGRRNWGRSQDTLAAISAARTEGTDVTIDVYPYTAGSTFLKTILPPWALDGGSVAMRQRLTDAVTRARIVGDLDDGLPGWQSLSDLAGWSNVVISGEGEAAGQRVGALAEASGQHPGELVMDLLLMDPAMLMILHMMDADEVVTVGGVEFALVGSDGVPVPGKQHPRLAGTFARVLAQAGGHEPALVDVVRRATALPAEKFNLAGRGTIASGNIADLVVFDAGNVADQATYDEPLLPPLGIDHVLLGGAFVIRSGALTNVRRGAVLAPA